MCVLERGTKEKKKRVLSIRKGIESKGSCYGYAGIFYRISTYYQKSYQIFSLSNEYNLKIISSVTNFSTGKEEFRPECPLLKEERGEHPSGDNFVFLFVFEK